MGCTTGTSGEHREIGGAQGNRGSPGKSGEHREIGGAQGNRESTCCQRGTYSAEPLTSILTPTIHPQACAWAASHQLGPSMAVLTGAGMAAPTAAYTLRDGWCLKGGC